MQSVTIFVALDCVTWDKTIVPPYDGTLLGDQSSLLLWASQGSYISFGP